MHERLQIAACTDAQSVTSAQPLHKQTSAISLNARDRAEGKAGGLTLSGPSSTLEIQRFDCLGLETSQTAQG